MRSKAVVLQIPVPQRPGPAVVRSGYQPDWAVEAGILVGYQGDVSPKAVQRTLTLGRHELDDRWDSALVRVRPRSPLRTGPADHSLRGLTLFDTKTAHSETKALLGARWLQAASRQLQSKGQSLDALNTIDFRDPRQYIPAFPECAAEIFRDLPDLDVIIGIMESPITGELAWIAMAPISKLSYLVEEAYVRISLASLLLQAKGEDGEFHNIALPGKKKLPKQRH